jgi:hypothetical protein
MKKYQKTARIYTLILASLLIAACATKAPSPVAKTETKAPDKIAKQRTVVKKVPVLAKETSYYSDGLVDEYAIYKLDDSKKLLLEKDSYDGSRVDPTERLVSEYKEGRLAAETTYEYDGRMRSRRELSYDSSGRLASERVLDSKGKTLSSSTYAYDGSGRKVEWRVLDASLSTKATTSYTYGQDGLSAIEMKDIAGKTTGTIKLEYLGGKLAKRSYFGADGLLQKYEAYAYSGAALSSIEDRRGDGSLSGKTTYEYGSLGELVKMSEYDAANALRSYTSYEYSVREDNVTETYFD